MLALVRYGAVPEVARCQWSDQPPLARGDHVVVMTHRGLQIGQYLQSLKESSQDSEFQIERPATSDDLAALRLQQSKQQAEFTAWQQRITNWRLELELLDLEWTLDGQKLILYVLSGRGPDCTKLALQAAAAGLGAIEVQPVSAEGLVSQPETGGGCGTGGCGCSH